MQALRKLAFLTAACAAFTGIAAAMPAVSLSASAESVQTSGICGEDNLFAERYVRWELEPETGTLTISGEGNMYNYLDDYDPAEVFAYLREPENIGYSDRAEPAPWGKDIKKVIVEEGVKSIGRYAFCGCSALESVTLSDTVETVEGYAFSNSGIREITLPNGISYINDCAFYDCTELRAVSGRTSVIGSYAFFHCAQLESIELPPQLYYVGDRAFSGCKMLSDLTLPDSLTQIGTAAFENTAWLEAQFCEDPFVVVNEHLIACSPELEGDIKIPEGIAVISDGAFENNEKITSVIIPDGVAVIREHTFYYCTALKEVQFPSTLVGIDAEAFRGCKALEAVDFPKQMSYIGQEAFRECSSLTEVLLSSYVNTIGYGAFADCILLSRVIVQNPYLGLTTPPSSDLQYFSNSGGGFSGVIFGYEESAIRQYAKENDFKFESLGHFQNSEDPNNACGKFLEWSVDDNGTLTISGKGDMYDFWQPSNDYTVEYDDSYNPTPFLSMGVPWNTNIKAVVIEEGVTSIGAAAFLGCSALKSVVIADSVTKIGLRAFEDCMSLTSVTIPDGVTCIPEYAFRNTALSAPVLPKSLKSIGESAFSDCGKLTKIVIPDGTETIGASAFRFCTKLSSVRLTDTITDVGPRAFESTAWLNSREKTDTFVIEKGVLLKASSKLTGSITIPDGVRVIGGLAFEYVGYVSPGGDEAKQVPEITLPEGVVTISKLAFCWCTSLQKINLPSTLTTIEESAFFNCFALENVTLPGNLRTIGASAFRNCESLRDITIPKSVNRIESRAFDKCDSLQSVTILNPAVTIYNAIDTFTNASGIENDYCFTYSGVIRGFFDSTAEWYAQRYSRRFEQLDSSFSDAHKLGDLTADGSVDVSDAVLLARFLNADTEAVVTDEGRVNADCNQDGRTDTADLTDLLRFIAKKITL